MSRLLRHRGKRRHRKGSEERRGRIAITHELSERPPEASDRSRAGDWEGDTVAGRQGGPCLVTLVDRMTGYLAGGLAPRKAAAEVTAVIESSLSGGALETLTLDRGKEFAKAAQIQDELGMPVSSACLTTPGRRAPTRTPTASSGTSSPRARAWTGPPARRSRLPMLRSTAGRASAWAGSAPRRSSIQGRCTYSEDSPFRNVRRVRNPQELYELRQQRTRCLVLPRFEKERDRPRNSRGARSSSRRNKDIRHNRKRCD